MERPAPGFTLLELMTTLVVLGVVLALGIPAFSQVFEEARVSAAYHAATASLSAARMAAITRRTPVSVCPSRDGLHCRDDRVWEEGWITYLDRSRKRGPASAGDVLQHTTPGLRGVAVRSTVGRHRLRYHPSGLSRGSNLSLWICTTSNRREFGRVAVNNGGRVRSERRRVPTDCRYTP